MKQAIIMGASSGMGLEIARRLLKDGWELGLAARRLEPLKALAAEASQHVEVARIDITEAGADMQLQELFDKMGHVDLYFHVSGIGKLNAQLRPDIELATVSTNALGFARMVGQAYRYFADHGGGHIAVISSIAGYRGLGPSPSYSATKAFQHNYIQALEQQANARRLNIRFTEIRPGFVDTPLLTGARFPMTMPLDQTVDEILWAVDAQRHVRVIDWKYRVLVFLWRLVPSFIWRHLSLGINTAHNASRQ
jgi:NADP-dependent 3-hydroxy acid dehydrogenase YdfG